MHVLGNFTTRSPVAATLLACALLIAPQAQAALEVGATAPDFTISSALAGKVSDFALARSLKQGPVVLYFFPAAFTSGCNREAHAFADRIGEFQALGATVIGVSNDAIETIAKFSVQECAGKFSVGADPDSAVIKAYDAKFPLIGKANRVSYVIDRTGKVRYVYSALSPEGHIENTLKTLKALSLAP
jgi:peroxiredoxin